MRLRIPFLALTICLALCTLEIVFASGSKSVEEAVDGFFSSSGHTNNWAVLVCTSRFWFNYRHIANALSMYRTVKRLGIPDSNIILMLADDVACNPRNVFPATVFNNAMRHLDLYGDNVEVDYRGYEVTVENFIRVLTGRVSPDTPRSKRLLSDDRSNVFVYMTGHGGNEFLKFQDAEEISAYDLADAFEQMWEKRRYNELFFMIDTCQANTMYSKIYSPNILATGSSQLGENSYSHHMDTDIGVAVIDRFTYYILEFLEKIDMSSKATMTDLFRSYDKNLMSSSPGVRDDLFKRPLDQVRVTDFFGSVQSIELTITNYSLSPDPKPSSLPLSSAVEFLESISPNSNDAKPLFEEDSCPMTPHFVSSRQHHVFKVNALKEKAADGLDVGFIAVVVGLGGLVGLSGRIF